MGRSLSQQIILGKQIAMFKLLISLVVVLVSILGFYFSLSTLKNTAIACCLVRASCTYEKSYSCEDPYASDFVPFLFKYGVLPLVKIDFIRKYVIDFYDSRLPGAYYNVWYRRFNRTLWIDKKMREHAFDCEQFVILGAGYDTRFVRMKQEPFLAGKDLYEVDLAKVQETKKDWVTKNNKDVKLIAGNLDVDDWMLDMIENHGFDIHKKTFFLAEGLLIYLQPKTVQNLFQNISDTVDEVIFILTYPEDDAMKDPDRYYGSKALRKFYEDRGEYGYFGLNRVDSKDYFSKLGFELKEDIVWSSEESPFEEKNKYRSMEALNMVVLSKTKE